MKKYITLKNFGWLLTALVTFMLGMSGVSKIVGTEEMIKNFTSMNLLPYLALLGAVELAGVDFQTQVIARAHEIFLPDTRHDGKLIATGITSAKL